MTLLEELQEQARILQNCIEGHEQQAKDHHQAMIRRGKALAAAQRLYDEESRLECLAVDRMMECKRELAVVNRKLSRLGANK